LDGEKDENVYELIFNANRKSRKFMFAMEKTLQRWVEHGNFNQDNVLKTREMQ
jgi:hypothetical protein